MKKHDSIDAPVAVPLSGRYIFRDDFDDLQQWDVIGGSPNISDSILNLSGTNTEVRSKRKFLYGILIVVARASASGNLRIGFDDGGNDYVVWSGGNLRYKSTVDPTEGTTAVSITETSYNVFVILWEPDGILIWVNGTLYTPYQGIKTPNKPLPISLKNLSTGTSQIDFVAVYPELAGVWLGVGSGGAQANVGIPVLHAGALASGTNPIGYVRGTREKLLAAPYTDTTTALGANATFTGTSRDRQIDGTNYEYYKRFVVRSLADQPGTLYVDESPDGSTWINGVKSANASANVVAEIVHEPIYRHVRCRYVNGPTAQGSFRIWSKLGTD
jgi:hypothetical protein